MTHDDCTKPGSAGFKAAGIGIVMRRNCLVGQHHVTQTAGGSYVRYRGVRGWACGACAADLAAKRETRAAA
jgi:hypothetical protein